MHIITIDDLDFPDLQEVFDKASPVGNFIKDGKVQIVKTNQKLVMVSERQGSEKIAVCPVRGRNEAEQVAKKLLEEAKEHGQTVIFSDIVDDSQPEL